MNNGNRNWAEDISVNALTEDTCEVTVHKPRGSWTPAQISRLENLQAEYLEYPLRLKDFLSGNKLVAYSFLGFDIFFEVNNRDVTMWVEKLQMALYGEMS